MYVNLIVTLAVSAVKRYSSSVPSFIALTPAGEYHKINPPAVIFIESVEPESMLASPFVPFFTETKLVAS